MPIHHIDHRTIPRLDEPATVTGLTIIVSVQCKSCDSPTLIGLLNAQPSVCEQCGAVFALESVQWQKGGEPPRIALNATPSRAHALLS